MENRTSKVGVVALVLAVLSLGLQLYRGSSAVDPDAAKWLNVQYQKVTIQGLNERLAQAEKDNKALRDQIQNATKAPEQAAAGAGSK